MSSINPLGSNAVPVAIGQNATLAEINEATEAQISQGLIAETTAQQQDGVQKEQPPPPPPPQDSPMDLFGGS